MPYSIIDFSELTPGQCFLTGGSDVQKFGMKATYPDGQVRSVDFNGDFISNVFGPVLMLHQPRFLPDLASFRSTSSIPGPGTLMMIDEQMFITLRVPDSAEGAYLGILDTANGRVERRLDMQYFGVFLSWRVVATDGVDHGDVLFERHPQ